MSTHAPISPHPDLPAISMDLRLDVRCCAWRWSLLRDALPAASESFLEHSDLAAIELDFIEDQASGGSRHLSGVPQAWMYTGSGPVPYIPDMTGDGVLSGALWQVGVEAHCSALLGEIGLLEQANPGLHSILITRLCVLVCPGISVDPGGGMPHPASRRSLTLNGLCDRPASGHAEVALRSTLRSMSDVLTGIAAASVGRRENLVIHPRPSIVFRP